jgi:hypothetical protein
MLISEVRVSQSIGSIFNENLFAAKYRPTLLLKGPGVKSSSIENASGATKQKLPAGKVPISKNLAFLTSFFLSFFLSSFFLSFFFSFFLSFFLFFLFFLFFTLSPS